MRLLARPNHPAAWLVAAGVLFGAIFGLRLAVDEVEAAIAYLFAFPVALLAIRFGPAGGLAGAAVASGLLLAWVLSDDAVRLGTLGYESRIGTYLLIGGLVGFFSRRSSAALQASQKAAGETAAILDSTTDAVFRLDPEGRCVFANQAAAEVLGWSPDELRGRDLHTLVHHSRLDGTPYPADACPVHATLRDGAPRAGTGDEGQEVYWHRDGSPVVVDSRVASVADGGGAVLTLRDVSDRDYDRTRLRRYAERLGEVDSSRPPAPGDGPRGGEAAGDPADPRIPPDASDRAIREVLDVARDRLGMDIAFVGRFEDGHESFPIVVGDAPGLAGSEIPLERTYCSRMVAGTLPNAVRDAQHDERVGGLAATADAEIGAYLGVPIRLPGGRLFGALCVISHDAKPALDDRDVRFMEVLSTLVGRELERRELDAERRRLERQHAAAYTEATHVRALIAALESRDEYTGSHSESVVELARRVAERLDLDADAVTAVEHTALLHDIGKVGVPDAILQKPGRLDGLEWEIMRQHPAIGARLIESIEPLRHLAPAIRAEHERWDGGGYPDGLAGEQIPVAARIGFACDAFHAMTSDRPYRRAMPQDDALDELRRNAGTQFDPEVVEALLELLGDPAERPELDSNQRPTP